jgi:hypothetical protein
MRLVQPALRLLAIFTASPALANMVAEPVDWKLGGTTFNGRRLAWS